MTKTHVSVRPAEDFYAEIMPTEGIGAKTYAASTASVSKATAFFSEKRAYNKDRVVETAGSSMSFENVALRNRGIRPWERAKLEAYERRQRDLELYRQRNNPYRNGPKKIVSVAIQQVKIVQSFPTKRSASETIVDEEPRKVVIDAWDD